MRGRINKTLPVILLCILAGGIFSAGLATEKVVKKKADLTRGKEIYDKYCYYCHGREGRGDGAIAMGLTPKPANFVDDVERMKKSDEALFQSIARGIHRQTGGEAIVMPEWDLVLTEDDIWDVIGYIRYLSEKGRAGSSEKH